MFIDLTELLSERHTPIEREVRYERKELIFGFGTFSVAETSGVQLSITHRNENEIQIKGEGEFQVELPCDRCLKKVLTKIPLAFTRIIKQEELQKENPYTEFYYINGKTLDTEALLYNELLTEWPDKTLCCEACRGICSICGQDQNERRCGCSDDRWKDPRMSAIQDVFQQFKEV